MQCTGLPGVQSGVRKGGGLTSCKKMSRSTALRMVECWCVTTMYDVIPLRALGALPFEYMSGLSCIERIRSSTTVDATGSRPAVGSSYMMTCMCVSPEQVCSTQTTSCLLVLA